MAAFNNTIITTGPNRLSPVNDLWGNYFILQNNSSTASNFKYLTKLYAYDPSTPGTTFSFIVTNPVPPRPVTGFGEYSGYQSLLSLVDYDLQPSLGTPSLANDSLTKYYINYGFQLNPGLSFSQVLIVPIGATSYFGFTFSELTSLQPNDLITIQSQNPFFGNKTASVTSNISPFSFYTNLIANTASNITTGIVSDLKRWNGTSSSFYGYNGNRQYGFQNTNYYNKLIMGATFGVTSSQPFLTEYPLNEQKYILPGQYETLSMFINKIGFGSPTPECYINYKFYNSSGSNIHNQTNIVDLWNGSIYDDVQRWDIPVGTNYIPTFVSDSSYYTVNIQMSTGTGLVNQSETRTFLIDRSCSLYNNVRVMWLNSYGAFDFFNFRLDDKKTYNISTNEYKKVLPINYVIGDRQRTTLSSTVRETHVINTNWVTENIYAYLQGFLTSNEQYIIDENTGNPYPIIITDKSFDFKTAYRDKIFNLTVTYDTSYDIERQKQ